MFGNSPLADVVGLCITEFAVEFCLGLPLWQIFGWVWVCACQSLRLNYVWEFPFGRSCLIGGWVFFGCVFDCEWVGGYWLLGLGEKVLG